MRYYYHVGIILFLQFLKGVYFLAMAPTLVVKKTNRNYCVIVKIIKEKLETKIGKQFEHF